MRRLSLWSLAAVDRLVSRRGHGAGRGGRRMVSRATRARCAWFAGSNCCVGVPAVGCGEPPAGRGCGVFPVVIGSNRVWLREAAGAGVDEPEVEVSGVVCGIEGSVGDEEGQSGVDVEAVVGGAGDVLGECGPVAVVGEVGADAVGEVGPAGGRVGCCGCGRRERGEAFGGVGAGLAVGVVGPRGVGVEDFVERDAVTDVELLAERGCAVAPLVGW